MTQSSDQPVNPSDSRGGFTLIELLVVLTIIAVLIAILMPAMSRAIYSARVAVCLSRAHQQALAGMSLATDNNGQFPLHHSVAPERYRTKGVPNNLYQLLNDGGYLTDGRLTICPIIAVSDWAVGWYYADSTLGNGAYGGWESNAANITSSYMWTANFKPWDNGTVTYLDNEPPWPKSVSRMRADAMLISHRISQGTPPRPNFNVHDVGHNGRGGSIPSITLEPVVNPDNPVVFGDLSAISRPQSDIQKRVHISGRAFFSVGYLYY